MATLLQDYDDLDRLAQSYRILANEGHGDGTLGHVSFRDRENRGFWIKRSEIGMDEVVDQGDLLLVGFDGDVIAGSGGLHSEWPIHAAVLRNNSNINAVIHTHARHASLLSASNLTIEPLTTEGGYFVLDPVRTFESSSAHIDNADVAEDLAEFLGSGPAVLLRNHGLVACGASIGSATLAAVYLERAAAIQLAASNKLGTFQAAAREEMNGRALMLKSATFVEQNFDYYARRISS